MITVLSWLVGIAVGIIGCAYFSYFYQFNFGFSKDPGVWGQFGDFVGGTINPILTFLTFLALVFTVVLQTRQLEHSREELLRSIESQNASAAAAHAQIRYANASTRLAALQASLAVTTELLSQAQAAGVLAGPAQYASELLRRKEAIAGEILRITNELLGDEG